MKVFHYISGEIIKVGDRVKDAGHRGRAIEIIQPGSYTALSCDCAEGGVHTVANWGGKKGSRIWEPPDRENWEDLVFLQRRPWWRFWS